MFDDLGEAGLLAEMSGALRAERASMARRLLAAGRLCQLRMADSVADDADRSQWCIDNWEAVAAEVGAELGVSRGRASSQMSRGLDLLERFPKLAAVFAAGEVDFRVVAVALFRTGLITDPGVLDAIDTQLARCAPGWNALSYKRLTEYLDWRVRELDPAAERVARESHADRHVGVGPGPGGLADLWGRLGAPDAALFDRRLDDLAATVCRADSRTREQRRADAVGALAAGATSLACDCGLAECPARDACAPAGQIVIHLLAEAATVSGAGDRPALLPGYGAVPAETVRDLCRRAKLRPLASPQGLGGEDRYRPSKALADFIRARDLCCRFPGCDAPAAVCDIDHTVPHGCGGPTHPANLGLLCRVHHLLKTFWTGEKGWGVVQFADGTMSWTAPSGRVYTTTPQGVLYFPGLAVPTEELNGAAHQSDSRPGRTLLMPVRKRTRAAERAARIAWERGLNEARWAADPPPF